MKNKDLKIAILVTIFLIGIAYAAITTNLTINGNTNIAGNNTNFQNGVVFSGATTSDGTVTGDGTKTLTFTTKELTQVGQTAVLSYAIKNTSIYGASVGLVSCTSSDSTYSTYLKVTSSRTKTLTVAKSKTSAVETITVELLSNYPNEDVKEIVFTCTMTATATSA